MGKPSSLTHQKQKKWGPKWKATHPYQLPTDWANAGTNLSHIRPKYGNQLKYLMNQNNWPMATVAINHTKTANRQGHKSPCVIVHEIDGASARPQAEQTRPFSRRLGPRSLVKIKPAGLQNSHICTPSIKDRERKNRNSGNQTTQGYSIGIIKWWMIFHVFYRRGIVIKIN